MCAGQTGANGVKRCRAASTPVWCAAKEMGRGVHKARCPMLAFEGLDVGQAPIQHQMHTRHESDSRECVRKYLLGPGEQITHSVIDGYYAQESRGGCYRPVLHLQHVSNAHYQPSHCPSLTVSCCCDLPSPFQLPGSTATSSIGLNRFPQHPIIGCRVGQPSIQHQWSAAGCPAVARVSVVMQAQL